MDSPRGYTCTTAPLTVKAMSASLQVSKATIHGPCQANAVPFFKIGKLVRFHPRLTPILIFTAAAVRWAGWEKTRKE
jgi:hypothetical protein